LYSIGLSVRQGASLDWKGFAGRRVFSIAPGSLETLCLLWVESGDLFEHDMHACTGH